MKKILLSLIAVLSIALITGCSTKVEKIEGTLETLMTTLYSNIPDDQKPMMLMNTEVTKENIEYYLGSADIEYEEALASESGVGSIAHSVVLLRTKENADIESIKTKIKEKINPRKWICVGVAEEDVIVKNKGDLVILIMIEDEATREKINTEFESL